MQISTPQDTGELGQNEIVIIGLLEDVQIASQRLMQKRKEIIKTNKLSNKLVTDFISKCSVTSKKQIESIASAASVKVIFEADYTLTIQGINISNVSDKIIDFISEQFAANLTTSGTESLIFPVNWDPQADNCELKSVAQHSPEWIKVEKRLNETLPHAKISKLERVQNRFLWTRYFGSRKLMEQKNGNANGELELFHGTRNTHPSEVYNGEDGFDMRFGTSGMWGNGIYFAVNASYSNGYTYPIGDQKQFFLANVLVGDTNYCPPDGNIRIPPIKKSVSTNIKFQTNRYDSVSGDTGGSRVYILYTHGRAYPTYLITYK